MRIVFFETQPWEKDELQKAFPEATFVTEKLSEENVSEYNDAEVISIFVYCNVTKDLLTQLPNLKFITTRSTGYDHIDTAGCKEKNVAVANVPEYGSNTVAEFTFGLLLDLLHKITRAVEQAKRVDFNHTELIGTDLQNKTLGIIGLGKIGMNVLKIAKAFEMNVLVHNRSQKPELAQQYGFTYVDVPVLLQQSDIVTLHTPLTNETKHMINKENISLFKKGSYLINTARGGLIDTEALVFGLENNILAGVAIDVLENEDDLLDEVSILSPNNTNPANLKTMLLDHVLLNHPKVLITPHNAFNSREALSRITSVTIENIQNFIAGKHVNSVF